MRVRNKSKTEDDFINGSFSENKNDMEKGKKEENKCKPFSISLNDEYFQLINRNIQFAVKENLIGTSRSDVIKAALIAFEQLSDKEKINLLIK
ncbi:hypothetical protein CBG25_11690 [Arsenophonus sp. ENCA]|uniref:hypothetical protein n=1 Tax=Arsenophonus sp. ENCA TaxID=1987579 RepID=UPI000BD8DA18|nr:hypothetical protein [Arsenophonus sp. ENCA]PAV02303.1 hypothetical protein CBG25_11690 [Arsenophonus sp. ENCA]